MRFLPAKVLCAGQTAVSASSCEINTLLSSPPAGHWHDLGICGDSAQSTTSRRYEYWRIGLVIRNYSGDCKNKFSVKKTNKKTRWQCSSLNVKAGKVRNSDSLVFRLYFPRAYLVLSNVYLVFSNPSFILTAVLRHNWWETATHMEPSLFWW